MKAGDLVRFKPECPWVGRHTGVIGKWVNYHHIRVHWINTDGSIVYRTERPEHLEVISECQTPGAIYHIHIHDKSVGCEVDLPMRLNLNEQEAQCLEDKIHTSIEEVLKEYFSESR